MHQVVSCCKPGGDVLDRANKSDSGKGIKSHGVNENHEYLRSRVQVHRVRLNEGIIPDRVHHKAERTPDQHKVHMLYHLNCGVAHSLCFIGSATATTSR